MSRSRVARAWDAFDRNMAMLDAAVGSPTTRKLTSVSRRLERVPAEPQSCEGRARVRHAARPRARRAARRGLRRGPPADDPHEALSGLGVVR